MGDRGGEREERYTMRIYNIPGDICQAGYIADEQKHPQCLMRISFWGADVRCNLEFL